MFGSDHDQTHPNQFFPPTPSIHSGRQGELRQKDLELERLREELELLKVRAQEAQKLHSQLEIFKKRLEEMGSLGMGSWGWLGCVVFVVCKTGGGCFEGVEG